MKFYPFTRLKSKDHNVNVFIGVVGHRELLAHKYCSQSLEG